MGLAKVLSGTGHLISGGTGSLADMHAASSSSAGEGMDNSSRRHISCTAWGSFLCGVLNWGMNYYMNHCLCNH